MMKHILFNAALTFSFLASGQIALAQKSQIDGRISDSTGAVVPNARITVTDVSTGIKRKAATNHDGYYTVGLLEVGNYELLVEMDGFKQIVRSGIKLSIGEVARIDFVLELGEITQRVEVTEDASPLNFDNAELKTGIPPETINELPLLVSGAPRAAASFLTLLPGVTSPTGDIITARLNGGGQYGGNVVLDGVGMYYPGSGNGMFNVASSTPQTPDMISEIKVLTSNYQPQYGNSASGVVILETKSGTNTFHGTLYEFLRNTALNARQFGSDVRSKDIENDFGGSLAGPVKLPGLTGGRTKTFFFFNYERYRSAGGLTSPVLSIPSLQERNGDFRDWTDPGTGNLIPIYDPATTRIVNGQVVRDQFMGCNGNTPNVICPTDPRLQNSLAKQWFQFLPSPNLPGPLNNYRSPRGLPGSGLAASDYINLRIDEYFGEKDHLTFTTYWATFPDNIITVLPRQLSTNNHVAGSRVTTDRLNWDHTFTPAVLNHFGFGYHVTRGTQKSVDAPYANVLPKISGVPVQTAPPVINFTDGFSSFGEATGAGSYFPGVSFIANDMLTWVPGKHIVKAGLEIRRYQINNHVGYNDMGLFNFARGETGLLGSNTGSPIASFLLEQVASASMTVYGAGGVSYPRQHAWAAHVGDTWKVTPKLSIDYGVRFDFKPPSVEKYNRNSFFDPSGANQGAGGRPGRLAFAGRGWGSASYGALYPEKPFTRGFAPRLGIAYRFTDRTVFRVGYGIFYDEGQYPGWNLGVATSGFDANPAFSSSLGGLQAAFILSQGLPQNFTRPPIIDSTFLNGQGAPNYRPFGGNRLPYTQQWNLNIEHQFTPNFYVSAAYVGNHGTRLPSRIAALNALDPKLLSLGNALNDQFGPTDNVVDGVPAPYPGWAQQMAACAPSVAQALLPYPQYCGPLIGINENAGSSSFQSLQIKAEKRASHGLWMLSSYTFSKLIDNSDSNEPDAEVGVTTGVISPFQRARNKSLAVSDIPHAFSVAVVYEFPFGRGKRWFANLRGPLDMLIGGWETSSVFRMSSGAPLWFRSSTCNVPSQFVAACIPGILPGATPYAQSKGSFDPNKPWLDAAAFENPANFNFYFGQGPRVSNVRGFGYHNQDVAFMKNILISEHLKFQLRAEFFNIWNWHIFAVQGQQFNLTPFAFVNDVANPGFGMWNGSVTAPRNIQISGRLTF